MADLNHSDPKVITARAAAGATSDRGNKNPSFNAAAFFSGSFKDEKGTWNIPTQGVTAILGESTFKFYHVTRKDPMFPQPIKQGRRHYWDPSEVLEYKEKRKGPTDKDQMTSGSTAPASIL